MADFSGRINLLGFKGARLFSGLDPKHPSLNYVCIPVAYNEVALSQDGKYANVSVYMQETNDKFRQACIQRKQMSGDDMSNYAPPSHELKVVLSHEFREKAMEAARKRIVNEHSEWQADSSMQQPDTNKELEKLMYDAVRISLGMFYARIRQQQKSANAVAPKVGDNIREYNPATDPFGPAETDDLPF